MTYTPMLWQVIRATCYVSSYALCLRNGVVYGPGNTAGRAVEIVGTGYCWYSFSFSLCVGYGPCRRSSRAIAATRQ